MANSALEGDTVSVSSGVEERRGGFHHGSSLEDAAPLPSLSPEAARAQMFVVHSETFKVVPMPEGFLWGEGVIWKFVLRLFRACSKWLTAKILKTIQANKNTQAKPIKTHQ